MLQSVLSDSREAIISVAPLTDPRCLTTHALKKAGFTCARESGMPQEIANAIIGHVTSDMWQHYYIPSTARACELLYVQHVPPTRDTIERVTMNKAT